MQIVDGLEELGDSEVIRHKLIWEGKYWVWMNPDWYVSLLIARLALPFIFFFLFFFYPRLLAFPQCRRISSLHNSKFTRATYISSRSFGNRAAPLRNHREHCVLLRFSKRPIPFLYISPPSI